MPFIMKYYYGKYLGVCVNMIVLKNFMEELVFDAVKDLSKELSVCTCEKCMLDVAAIALNDLPPKYVVTEKGKLYSKIETLKQQFEVDIITAVTKAIEKVNKNPQHEGVKGV